MKKIENIEFELERESLLLKLGIDEDDEDDIRNFNYLLAEACRVGSPKLIFTESRVSGISRDSVVIDGIEFSSAALARNLTGKSRCFPYIVSCGIEIDHIILSEDSPFVDFWKDEIKAILLMRARKYLNEAISSQYGIDNLASMAPGSGDTMIWRVEEQQKLFSLFAGEHRRIGVELTKSSLMLPNKSLSGIAFEADKEFFSCQLCQRESCPDRKIGFDESLYYIMHQSD